MVEFWTIGIMHTIGSNTIFFDGNVATPELAVTSTDVNAMDPWFDATSYIGAFGPADSASSNWAAGWTLGDAANPARHIFGSGVPARAFRERPGGELENLANPGVKPRHGPEKIAPDVGLYAKRVIFRGALIFRYPLSIAVRRSIARSDSQRA